MKLKSLAAAAMLAGVLSIGTVATPASAVSVGGGTWNYGTCAGGPCGTGGIVFSDYFHSRVLHRSTACSNVRCVGTSWVNPGLTARSSTPSTMWGNAAYWATY